MIDASLTHYALSVVWDGPEGSHPDDVIATLRDGRPRYELRGLGSTLTRVSSEDGNRRQRRAAKALARRMG